MARPVPSVTVRILVIGSGAREHALLRALARDPSVTELHVAPGNAGTARLAQAHPVTVGDPAAIAELAGTLRADLVVIGPEVPLVNGAVDELRPARDRCLRADRGRRADRGIQGVRQGRDARAPECRRRRPSRSPTTAGGSTPRWMPAARRTW